MLVHALFHSKFLILKMRDEILFSRTKSLETSTFMLVRVVSNNSLARILDYNMTSNCFVKTNFPCGKQSFFGRIPNRSIFTLLVRFCKMSRFNLLISRKVKLDRRTISIRETSN